VLNFKEFPQLPFEHLIVDLLLFRILDFIKFDGDNIISPRIFRRPDDALPTCADLLEELILMELETGTEFIDHDAA
jgi:hypothetical protein